MGKGRVIGIDITIRAGVREALAAHPLAHRVTLLEGDSAAAAMVADVRGRIVPGEKVLLILDSNHTKAHVAAELEAYAPFVTPGSCIVAADGIMRDLADVPAGESEWTHDHPAAPEWKVNTSPLTQNVTYWPDGWLWRKA
jgi:cephalosporin hydroxylase